MPGKKNPAKKGKPRRIEKRGNGIKKRQNSGLGKRSFKARKAQKRLKKLREGAEERISPEALGNSLKKAVGEEIEHWAKGRGNLESLHVAIQRRRHQVIRQTLIDHAMDKMGIHDEGQRAVVRGLLKERMNHLPMTPLSLEAGRVRKLSGPGKEVEQRFKHELGGPGKEKKFMKQLSSAQEKMNSPHHFFESFRGFTSALLEAHEMGHLTPMQVREIVGSLEPEVKEES